MAGEHTCMQAAKPAKAILRRVGSDSEWHPLDPNFSIGRRRTNSLALKSVTFPKLVSRSHAAIAWNEQSGSYVVADLDSTNGILVNEIKVKQKQLVQGDKISFSRAHGLQIGEKLQDPKVEFEFTFEYCSSNTNNTNNNTDTNNTSTCTPRVVGLKSSPLKVVNGISAALSTTTTTPTTTTTTPAVTQREKRDRLFEATRRNTGRDSDSVSSSSDVTTTSMTTISNKRGRDAIDDDHDDIDHDHGDHDDHDDTEALLALVQPIKTSPTKLVKVKPALTTASTASRNGDDVKMNEDDDSDDNVGDDAPATATTTSSSTSTTTATTTSSSSSSSLSLSSSSSTLEQTTSKSSSQQQSQPQQTQPQPQPRSQPRSQAQTQQDPPQQPQPHTLTTENETLSDERLQPQSSEKRKKAQALRVSPLPQTTSAFEVEPTSKRVLAERNEIVGKRRKINDSIVDNYVAGASTPSDGDDAKNAAQGSFFWNLLPDSLKSFWGN